MSGAQSVQYPDNVSLPGTPESDRPPANKITAARPNRVTYQVNSFYLLYNILKFNNVNNVIAALYPNVIKFIRSSFEKLIIYIYNK